VGGNELNFPQWKHNLRIVKEFKVASPCGKYERMDCFPSFSSDSEEKIISDGDCDDEEV
jgi:hypothetical protein